MSAVLCLPACLCVSPQRPVARPPTGTRHHHHHRHAHLYNINPVAGELIPPQPHDPSTSQTPPAPRAEPAQIASAGWRRGAAPAPQAQGPHGEPVRGAGGARPWDRDWGTVPDPLGAEALPPGGGGVLGWASSGTTRGMRNRFLRCRAPPEGQREPGGTSGGVGSPRGPQEGPPVSDLGGVARQGADVAGRPGGGGGAPHHGCGRQQLAPPGLAQRPHRLALPPAKPATAAAPTPTQAATQVTAEKMGARGRGGTVPRDAQPGGAGPPDPRPPHHTARRRGARHLPWEGGRGQRARGRAHCPAAH